AVDRLSDGGVGARSSEDRMTLERVREAIAELPDEQRAVVVLVAIEGYSYKEAAAVLETPVGTVMSRLSRARARLLPLVREET
ncbi:MAG: sigma-70 family RNA polymerase sigma factor, partial [Pseudomonadota bacterium]